MQAKHRIPALPNHNQPTATPSFRHWLGASRDGVCAPLAGSVAGFALWPTVNEAERDFLQQRALSLFSHTTRDRPVWTE
jgi:hypothetical protein